MQSDEQALMEQKRMWTAGLGAINSVRSPGGDIHHIFPFQMKETQLKIQVFKLVFRDILYNTMSTLA